MKSHGKSLDSRFVTHITSFFRRTEVAKLGKAEFQATAETGKTMFWSASSHAVNINLSGFSSAGTLITLSVVPYGRDGLI